MRHERRGRADPFEVAVVVDAHHLAASEADERQDGLELASVGPQI